VGEQNTHKAFIASLMGRQNTRNTAKDAKIILKLILGKQKM
jgi:hypothetical protein